MASHSLTKRKGKTHFERSLGSEAAASKLSGAFRGFASEDGSPRLKFSRATYIYGNVMQNTRFCLQSKRDQFQ
jgi:hypothetical protein